MNRLEEYCLGLILDRLENIKIRDGYITYMYTDLHGRGLTSLGEMVKDILYCSKLFKTTKIDYDSNSYEFIYEDASEQFMCSTGADSYEFNIKFEKANLFDYCAKSNKNQISLNFSIGTKRTPVFKPPGTKVQIDTTIRDFSFFCEKYCSLDGIKFVWTRS